MCHVFPISTSVEHARDVDNQRMCHMCHGVDFIEHLLDHPYADKATAESPAPFGFVLNPGIAIELLDE
jgi:hypothetical protein